MKFFEIPTRRLQIINGNPIVWLVRRDDFVSVYIKYEKAFESFLLDIDTMKDSGMVVSFSQRGAYNERYCSLTDKLGHEHRVSIEYKNIIDFFK